MVQLGRRRRRGMERRSSRVSRWKRSNRSSQRYTVERPTPKVAGRGAHVPAVGPMPVDHGQPLAGLPREVRGDLADDALGRRPDDPIARVRALGMGALASRLHGESPRLLVADTPSVARALAPLSG